MGPEFRMSEVITKICDGDLPNVWGWVFPGQMVLFICKAEMLESIYVQQNQFHTKAAYSRDNYSVFIPTTILWQDTDDP